MSAAGKNSHRKPAVVAICGGVGGAKLALGLDRLLGADLTIIVNTGDEVEAKFRDQIAKILDGMDIPRRDEFEAVKAMAAKAREENEELKKQIAELQARLLNTGP